MTATGPTVSATVLDVSVPETALMFTGPPGMMPVATPPQVGQVGEPLLILAIVESEEVQ